MSDEKTTIAALAMPDYRKIALVMGWDTSAYVMHLAEVQLNRPEATENQKKHAMALLLALEAAFENTIEDIGENDLGELE